MTKDEQQKIINHLMATLGDNANNRITLALMNGIAMLCGQYMDTLVKEEKKE